MKWGREEPTAGRPKSSINRDAVESFMGDCGRSARLEEIGVPGEALEGVAFYALGDMIVFFNGGSIGGMEAVIALYNEIYQ